MGYVLLADDEASALDELERLLVQDGHRCARVRDGAEALRSWQQHRHELVILDLKMPGMDGITATRRLKTLAEAERTYVPVLVVTGFGDDSRMEAYDAGADEFLTKPLSEMELRARVRTFLHIAELQRATEEAHRRLGEAQRMRDELIELIVHDLKNPLAALSENLEFIESHLPTGGETSDALGDCRESTSRLLRMVATILDVNRLEAKHFVLRLASQPIFALLDRIRRGRLRRARRGGILVEVVAEPRMEVQIDADLIGRVVENLLDNALRYTPSGGTIRLSAGPGPLGARIAVYNSGPAVPVNDRLRIFEKYGRLAVACLGGSNRGLGLYFCRLAVQAHAGRISVDDLDGAGARFLIDLPG